MSKAKYHAGIDEVGRGPLAGPVLACIVVLDNDFFVKHKSSLKELKLINPKNESLFRDSKKLTHIQRQKIFNWLKEQKVYYKTAYNCASQIDTLGISHALQDLTNNLTNQVLEHFPKQNTKFIFDAGLKPAQDIDYVITKKADEKYLPVALASVIAKVTRDAYMQKLSKKTPQYGFEKHKGYGTSQHIQAIKEYGLSPYHRKSFCKNIVK